MQLKGCLIEAAFLHVYKPKRASVSVFQFVRQRTVSLPEFAKGPDYDDQREEKVLAQTVLSQHLCWGHINGLRGNRTDQARQDRGFLCYCGD